MKRVKPMMYGHPAQLAPPQFWPPYIRSIIFREIDRHSFPLYLLVAQAVKNQVDLARNL